MSTERRVTALGYAFVDALNEKAPARWAKKLGRVCAKNQKAGTVPVRPINVNVSYRTAQKLKQEGILR